MYPCPHCHTQLTWVPQYQQYYCYFCHRYVPASGQQPSYQQPIAPVSQAYAPQQTFGQKVQAQPVQSPQPAVTPKPVGATGQMGDSSAPAPPQPAVNPATEYAPRGSPAEPATVPVSGQPAHGEPIYLCKSCGTKLEVSNQRWFCARCQQYK